MLLGEMVPLLSYHEVVDAQVGNVNILTEHPINFGVLEVHITLLNDHIDKPSKK